MSAAGAAIAMDTPPVTVSGLAHAIPPAASLAAYASAAAGLLVAGSGALLGVLDDGVLFYAAAFLMLGGAIWHGIRNGVVMRQGQLRILTLAALVPTAGAIFGLGGERALVAAGVSSSIAPAAPAVYLLLTTAAILALAMVVTSLAPAPRSPAPGYGRPHVAPGTLLVIDAALVAATAAVYMWFVRSGVVPMLYEGNKDEVRFAMTRGGEFAAYSRFIYIGSAALAVRLGLWAARAEGSARLAPLPTLVAVTPLFVGLVLFASKYLYVYPLAVAFLAWNRYRAPVRIWRPRVIVGFVVMLYLMVFVTNLRGLGRLVSNDLFTDVFIALPEYRDMAMSVAIADKLGMRVATYSQLLFAAVPSELLSIFGMVQKDDPAVVANVYKNLLGYTFAGGSVRVGLMGELFMNSRIPGVVVGMSIFAALLSGLDRAVAGWRLDGLLPLVALAFGFQTLWLFQSELPTALPIAYLFLYFLLLVLLVQWYQLRLRAARTPA